MDTFSLVSAGAPLRDNAALLLLVAKVTLLLCAALAATVVMRRASAGARHLVWLVTLGALLIVPALARWSPIHLSILPAIPSTNINAPGASVATTTTAAQSTQPIEASVRPAYQPNVRPRIESSPATTAHTGVVARLRDADPLRVMLLLWLTVAAAIAASLAYATLSLRRIVNNGIPLATKDWLDAVWEISDRIGLDNAPRLLVSSETKMPFACGILRPTIVLPIESESWSPDRRRAVLLHEFAHIRRRDLFGHTLGRIACALYWFHPLVWTAAKNLRSESERACDDLALMCGTGAADYAEHLLDIVTSVRGDRTPVVALAMARRKEFEGRMLAILDPQLSRAVPTRIKAATLTAALGALAIVVGAAAPTRRIERTSPVAPTAPSAAADRGVKEIPIKTMLIGPPRHVKRSLDVAPEPSAHENPLAESAAAFGRALASDLVARVQSAAPDLARRIASRASDDGASNDRFDLSSPGLAAQTPDERVALLAKVLATDTDANVRYTAAWGLAKYAEMPAASAALSQALSRDASAKVRESAAWALARDRGTGSPAVTALGSAVRNDASDSVRATAAWALGQIHDDAGAAALIAALGDRSARARLRIVWALGTLHVRTAPSALTEKLRDTDPRVRQMTAWALYSIRDTTAIPALQAALHAETDNGLKTDYIHALASMGRESLTAVRGMLESSDPAVKTMAVEALAGGTAAAPWPWPWPEPRPFP